MARAPVSKTGGCRFKSCHSCQAFPDHAFAERSGYPSLRCDGAAAFGYLLSPGKRLAGRAARQEYTTC